MSGTAAVFEVILNATIALPDNPTSFLFSLSESAVKD